MGGEGGREGGREGRQENEDTANLYIVKYIRLPFIPTPFPCPSTSVKQCNLAMTGTAAVFTVCSSLPSQCFQSNHVVFLQYSVLCSLLPRNTSTNLRNDLYTMYTHDPI